MYEANRWHADEIYNAPMASSRVGHVFTGDVITCRGVNGFPIIYAKILRFVKVVSITIIIVNLLTYFHCC